MITSEMVSILSVGLPALGAVVSAFAAFLGVVPGTDRKLHRLVTIHRDMPEGEGKEALEDALNELATRAARRAVGSRVSKQRPRRKLDAGKVIGAILIVLVGGGIAWVFWWLGSLAPWAWLQWTLWVIAILVTLFTTFVVTLDNVFQDDADAAQRKARRAARNAPTPDDGPVPADAPTPDDAPTPADDPAPAPADKV
ncbi:hypothetical protein [Promicromonospora sp. MEB111]|uniref:hypothetical protein n=1 Tax=Promicromonospora sp. MEB111 TaxID=3040301 RepID=UPI00254FD9D0|nr:hypothetical protein [Promicromonospora sp. MEB111]